MRFWCNHDQPRVVFVLAMILQKRIVTSAKMLAIALHMLQGTPYIYQGEEIGMTDPHFDSIQQYRDVESRNAYDNLMQQGIDESEVLTILGQKSRDNSRTPIQWTSEKQAGFTSGTPWIDIPNNAEHINVEAAIEDTTLYYTRIANLSNYVMNTISSHMVISSRCIWNIHSYSFIVEIMTTKRG